MDEIFLPRNFQSTTGSNVTAPGNAISGGYEGNSFAVRAVIVFFAGLAMYNVIELILLIFFTFKKYQGLYFWSLICAGIGIVPYSLGFMMKFLEITTGSAKWFAVTMITVGWWFMVTGQSIVLWSRLHLVVDHGPQGQRILRLTKIMIIVDAIILHIPTTVLTYGSNGTLNLHVFVTGYNVMEKIQMVGFFVQEVILSSIYIVQAARLLKHSMKEDRRQFMVQLVGINVIIILMDIGLVTTEAASFYLYETIIKGAIYSIKLKLEFAILGKLVQFVGRPGTSVANEERWRQASVQFSSGLTRSQASSTQSEKHDRARSRTARTATGNLQHSDLADFVDLSKVRTDLSHATYGTEDTAKAVDGIGHGGHQRARKHTLRRQGISEQDVEFAMFQHVDDATLPEDDAETIHTVNSVKPIVRDGEV